MPSESATSKGPTCPYQYYNQANPEAHYATTGPEIWQQTDGRVSHWVCGIGTGGTISGAGKYLKEQNRDVRVVGVDTVGSVYAHYREHGELPPPDRIQPYLIDGIGEDFLPETVWWDYIDEVVTVDDKTAYRTTMELARKEAIFVGSSGGAAAAGAGQVAASLPDSAVVVTLFPDSGERYLSKLNQNWMQEPAVGRAYKFADPIATTKRLVREIKADLYIVVSHCGIDVEKKLAESVPQLALVVGGHSHTPITHTFGTVLVSQTHAKSLSLGRVDIELDPDTWKVLKARATLLPVDPQTTPADPAVKAVIDKHRAVLGKKLQEVLGTLTEPARRKRGKFSSTAGNWMTDVIRDVGKAQIGFTNKGGLRADLEAGKVTLSDVYRLMPFENVVVSMDLTGSDVRSLILKHLSKRHSLEWSGMRVRINPDIVMLPSGRDSSIGPPRMGPSSRSFEA